MTYEEWKQAQGFATRQNAIASEALKDFPSLPNGLTPDATKADPKFQAAKKRLQNTHEALRKINGSAPNSFKRRASKERRAKWAANAA